MTIINDIYLKMVYRLVSSLLFFKLLFNFDSMFVCLMKRGVLRAFLTASALAYYFNVFGVPRAVGAD